MARRAGEIKTAGESWFSEDKENTCYMISLTCSHDFSFTLDNFIKSIKLASKKFWESSVNRIFKNSGRIGRITSFEFTFGTLNGWHPHQHILLFCRRVKFDVEQLRKYWISSLQSVGLNGNEHSFDIIEARSVDKYLTKTGLEMTMGNLKQGRGLNHFTPMQLLNAAYNGSDFALFRFKELFNSVRGLHVLYWSRGLKSRFNIGEFSDDEIASGSASEELQQVAEIYHEVFQLIPHKQKSVILSMCGSGDTAGALALIGKYRLIYRSLNTLDSLHLPSSKTSPIRNALLKGDLDKAVNYICNLKDYFKALQSSPACATVQPYEL